MGARGWYERLRLDGIELEERKAKVAQEREALGSTGNALEGSVSGGGNRDAMAQVDACMDHECKLAQDVARHDLELEQATNVLYGTSGRGGLAKATSTAEADCICGYYLMLMSWSEVAEEVGCSDKSWPKQWAHRRAMAGLRHIDQIGRDALADS